MKIWFFVILIILFGWTQWGLSQEISVVTEEWGPYNFTENNRITGYSTEVVEAVLQKANLTYIIKMYPWARAYKMALEEPNTLIYTMGRNDEREYLFKWVGPIAPRQLSLFKLKTRSDVIIRTLEDAKKYKIGVVLKDSSTQFLESKGFKCPKNLEVVTNYELNQRKLLAERVDLITGNEIALAFQLKQKNISFGNKKLSFEKLEKILLLIDENYWMGFSLKTSDKVVEQTQTALDTLRKESKLEEIQIKYLK